MPSALRCTAFLALVGASAACTQNGESQPPKPAATPAAETTSAAAPATSTAPAASAAPAAATAAEAPKAAPADAKGTGLPKDLNVLVVTVDSLRADMPWLGYPRDIAPVLTNFAKTAVSYSRFYAVSSYTAMSLGGFLSGRYPSELERSGYFFGNYPDSVLMFPELLQKAGVRTLTAHAHFYFDQKAGFRQGFDVYEIIPGLSVDNTTDKNVTSPQHVDLAKKILSEKANTGGRFFAWFHFLDPHDQYMPHDGIGPYGKSTRDKYDAEVTFTDQHLGKLFEFVDSQEWGKRTAIIVSSDHGDAFGEHGMYRHGFELWDVLTHVPLIIRAPGIVPRQIDEPRSGVDLAPTILEMFGQPKDPAMQGTSLVPELYGKDPEKRDVIQDLPRTSDNDRRRAFVRGDWKLIAEGDDAGYRFFNLKDDPAEKVDLKKKNADEFEKIKAAYKDKSGTIKDVCPKMREKLKGKNKKKPC
ncbi:sulfatase [Polyangium jinanense]|uniref:Sulfatase n=1 Tax=Polyangium jinanense TaxID=2829994 RepID=A0A9X4AX66_9BACT|nr:sulfatase [Polyangium jinanense]MDC3957754.1 sulfatase [Polyangium jinanense]MDC3987546.1 sulfatase [Polyangium jinanense]